MTVTVTVRVGAPCGSGVSVRTIRLRPTRLRPLVERPGEREPEEERERQPEDEEDDAPDGLATAPPRQAPRPAARLVEHAHGA